MFTKFIDHQLSNTERGIELQVTLNAPKYPILGFRSNMESALLHLANTTNKPVNIRYSGGLDSQALVVTAKDINIDFKVHHLTYTFNGQRIATTDYDQSEAFAKKAGIEVEYVIMELNKEGAPFKIQSPRHIYNEDTLVVGASGDAFHYNSKNLVGNPYWYDDFFYFPMDVITQLRLWSSYGRDIYTRFYSESAELFFSMLYHPSLDAFRAFIKDNPEKHMKYDFHQMKFVLLHAEYGDELIYFDKKHASDELPKDITERHDKFAKQFWEIGNMWFKNEELAALYTGKEETIVKTMVIPEHLRHLLWDVKIPLTR